MFISGESPVFVGSRSGRMDAGGRHSLLLRDDGDVVAFAPAQNFAGNASCAEVGAAELAVRNEPPLYGGALVDYATYIQMPGVPAGTDTEYELCLGRAETNVFGFAGRRLQDGGQDLSLIHI